MLTTSFLACTAPRIVAPAMNDRMYADAATQANLATLRERGITVIEPDTGALASRGEWGTGRLPDAASACWRRSSSALPSPSGPWDGLRVLVTAGGTREPIDPVRFIGNRSSRPHGPRARRTRPGSWRRRHRSSRRTSALAEPPGVRRIDVETTAELAAAVGEEFPVATCC